MKITNFTVRFHRNIQPAKYEEAGAMVEFAGGIDDSDNPAKVTADALGLAKRQALAAVGIKGADTGGTGVINMSDATATKAFEPEPKEKGRPVTKKTKATKAAKKVADEAEDVAVAETEEAAGVAPGQDEVSEDPSEVTDEQLQDAANAAAKKHTGKVVKQLMTDGYKVQMLRDITVGDRPKFLKALRDLDKA